MAMIRRAFQFSRMLTTAAAPPIRSPMPALSQPSISPSPLFQVTRNYSTGEQLKEADIQVPLPMFGVTGNYASALYMAALKADKLDDVEKELKSVIEAAKGSPAFQSFMKNLSVPSKIRVKAMQDIFGEAGFSDITKNFLAVAAEHGRLRLLESIVNKFMRLTMAYYGEVNAIVTTVIVSLTEVTLPSFAMGLDLIYEIVAREVAEAEHESGGDAHLSPTMDKEGDQQSPKDEGGKERSEEVATS